MGFIGKALARDLKARGHHVTALSRSLKSSPQEVPVLVWDPAHPGGLVIALNGYDAVVNLAGASIADGRWTDARRRELETSRLNSTRALVDVISKCAHQPKVLVNASAVGYYGDRGNETLTEEAGPGKGFLADLCVKWEAEAKRAESLGLRVVLVRFGIVLGRGGGALPAMARPFKFLAGGPLGPGTQWTSWIHIDDATAILASALEKQRWQGPVNAVSPHPVINQKFAEALGRALHRPSWLRAPVWALRAAAGAMADEVILANQKAVPEKAKKLGYTFQHPRIETALRDLLQD